VELCLTGKILDTHYTQVLIKHPELSLDDVLLLDMVQKNKPLKPRDAKRLKIDGLIEGRAPNHYISAKVSEWTKQRASYIHNRAFDDEHYKNLIIKYLQQYNEASRKDIDDLLFSKLSDVLGVEQKRNKIRNFLQDLRQSKKIINVGTKRLPQWRLLPSFTTKTPP
jgi:ATP-dependent DNA helicase RecG